jgi:hypothetical protein
MSLNSCRGANIIVRTGGRLPIFVTPKYAFSIPCYVVASLRHNRNHPLRDRATNLNHPSLSLRVTRGAQCLFVQHLTAESYLVANEVFIVTRDPPASEFMRI